MFDNLKVEKRWTVSNLLSISRILFLVPVVILLLKPGSEYRVTVVILMFIAGTTDFLDGLLARMMNQVTDFGRLLDPMADKICIVVASVTLVVTGDIPLWFMLLVAARDVAIVVGSSLILNRRKVVVQSVWAGKLTVNFLAAYIIIATLRIPAIDWLKTTFMFLSILFIFISFGVYLAIYFKRMANENAG